MTRRGDFTIALDPASQLSAGARAAVLTGWESLRVVAIGDAFLQVLADPTSDQRRILVMDAGGRLVREMSLNVAMGFLDADEGHKLLVALRNVGRTELVYYRWHWRN
ncbi:MAG: hypothetical protein IPK85_04315 [Gemmatimonadetes bacterium]|nr:hypothetical protein [Gemmatimonadota bacterium]